MAPIHVHPRILVQLKKTDGTAGDASPAGKGQGMIAEILSTGEEIRCGHVVDSNAAHIAGKLDRFGVQVTRHTSVGDGLEEIAGAIKEMGKRADMAVVTGGLGPTADDRTAEAAAAAAGVPCREDAEALAAVERFFTSRKRPMAPSNRKQASLPRGASPLTNPVGTAPGFRLKIGRCLFFFLPGVPREMKRMLDDGVLPAVSAIPGPNRNTASTRTIVTFGLTESDTGEQLAGFADRFPDLTLGLQVRFPEILVKIYGRSNHSEKLEKRMSEAGNWIGRRLGCRVVCPDGGTMFQAVGRLLGRRGETLALAESCTGGLMAHGLTQVPGSSDYFLFSGVVYANAAKTAVLGVPETVLAGQGAVHEATALAMADGARRVAGADWALSTTGIAGPGGGSREKPVGTVCIGLAGPEKTMVFRYHFPFEDREMNKRVFAFTALDKLRRHLLDNPVA
jgi:competence/damage-inducible protein CinA-like protein